MENRALGKGLSALIPQKADATKSAEGTIYLKISEIKDNTHQPRSFFDDEKLADLINSIREKGVIQPILVRQKGDAYEVIAGERRLRAARALGMEDVPVIIKNVTDQEALVLALVENIQRQELNAIEEALAFKRLQEEFHFTQEAVAQSVGKDRTTVTNTLRLLKLPETIQQRVSDGTLTMGHARALLAIENIPEQMRLFEAAIRKNLSVRQLENLVKAGKGVARKGGSRAKDHYVVFLEEDLQKVLGTKVRIVPQKKRGKIIIEYYSTEELERVVGIIKK